MNEDGFNADDFEKAISFYLVNERRWFRERESFYVVNELLRFCNNHCLLKLMTNFNADDKKFLS